MTGNDKILVELDGEQAATVVAALDLMQRVAMGQWREVVLHAPEVLRDDASGMFGPAGDALMQARGLFAARDELKHPNASLGIRAVHRQAQVASDLWHAFGGGMRDRQDDRIADSVGVGVVSSVPPILPSGERPHRLRVMTQAVRGELESWFEMDCPYEPDDDVKPCRVWADDDGVTSQPGCWVQQVMKDVGPEGLIVDLDDQPTGRSWWWVTVSKDGDDPVLNVIGGGS